jgi:hypothetical protein
MNQNLDYEKVINDLVNKIARLELQNSVLSARLSAAQEQAELVPALQSQLEAKNQEKVENSK